AVAAKSDITEIDEDELENLPDPEPLEKFTPDDADDEFDGDFDPEDFPDPDPIPAVLGSKADGAEGGRSFKGLIIGLVIFLLLGGILGGSVFIRETVVLFVPPVNAFYDLIGLRVLIPGEGLEIQNSKPIRETRDGKEVVVVNGVIANVTDEMQPVPLILAQAIDAGEQIVQTKTVSPTKSELAPGKKFNYSIIFEKLVPTARYINVTFGELEKPAGD
ncbi:MAG: hypothetical protein QGG84_05370, partial [Rhodospirillales bacterium]|nr:hypothetical protein [Rhodospirillales bacterium]